ncbi:MAG: arylmalonate decarboxylase [Actinomycetota bacterium]|nr:arylmalonate decarboxylase [Actinomycetota bacterium]
MPTVGLIVPPQRSEVPPDAGLLYPMVSFRAIGLGLESMTLDGYEAAIGRLGLAGEQLAAEGVAAISVMGTSLTFFRGAGFNEKLRRDLSRATGLPTTTMSTAIVRGLRQLGVRQLIAVTAYSEEVNHRLRIFLAESGFALLSVTGLGITAMDGPQAVSETTLIASVLAAFEEAGGQMDGVLISCGGLRTVDVVEQLEIALDIPVVSSDLAGLWDVACLVRSARPVAGHGRLLARGMPMADIS